MLGTGGISLYPFTGTAPNIEASNDRTYGVLKMVLHPNGYGFRVRPSRRRDVHRRQFRDLSLTTGDGPSPCDTASANVGITMRVRGYLRVLGAVPP